MHSNEKERVEFSETVINEEKFGFVFGFDSFFFFFISIAIRTLVLKIIMCSVKQEETNGTFVT